MDDYYLVTIDPPTKYPPILIKACSQLDFEKWSGAAWIKGDFRHYFMGDYEYRQVSLQEAEEFMRGIASRHLRLVAGSRPRNDGKR
jgi:hypothetical protein